MPALVSVKFAISPATKVMSSVEVSITENTVNKYVRKFTGQVNLMNKDIFI